VKVIYNFIDPDIYDRSRYPTLRGKLGDSGPVLMHISNFRRVKRVRDVVKIFARVNEKLPGRLVMIGDGPDRPEAEEEARTLGVDQRVHFLGKIDSVAPLLASADVFLLPSASESFGLSALEALASGVPVVGTAAGGMPEVVRNGETGVLCEPGDVDGMSSAALEILSDSDRWSAMSRLGAADARARFSLSEIVTQYEHLYTTSLA
jgi:N-acetyl-alpha-D-glucosaminyl L-malate synthase BshA